MNETLVAALIGALVGGGLAILGGIVGGIVVHLLNLREDRIKRERDKADKKEEELRKTFLIGIRPTSIETGEIQVTDLRQAQKGEVRTRRAGPIEEQ